MNLIADMLGKFSLTNRTDVFDVLYIPCDVVEHATKECADLSL